MAGPFAGKRGLIMGVANKRSIAWAIAQAARRRRREPRVHVPGRAHREDRCATSPRSVDSPLVTECDVRSDDDIARVFGEVVGRLRRRARHPRPLGRLRRRRGSRGPLHRHAARPLLDGDRRQRVLARRVRARGRAADGEGGRRLDPDDDVPRRRARRAALQRHGRREGDARLVREVPRVGSRREEHPRQRGLRRPGAHARRALDRRLPDDGGIVEERSPLHRHVTPTTSAPPPPTSSATARRT